MIGQAIQAKNVDRNTKKQKRPPKSLKNEMFIFGLCSTSDDWPSNLSKKCHQNTKRTQKRPPKLSKNKMFIFGLLQLLIIGWAIQAKNVDQNTKKPTSPPKTSKNKMFIFGLHSNSDDWPSSESKNGLKTHPPPPPAKKIKCSFLDNIQLLMISQADRWTQKSTISNTKKWKCSKLD